MIDQNADFANGEYILSFEDTAVAYRHKTDKELKQAYWLFKALNNGFLSKSGPSLVQAALKWKLPVQKLIKDTLFKHFCGGESMEDCNAMIDQLDSSYMGAILDYAAEGAVGEDSYALVTEEVVRSIKKAGKDQRIPFAVFKPTGVIRFKLLEKISSGIALDHAEQVELFKAKGRINHICKSAYDADVPVMMDAEESWIQKAVDQICREMMRMYNRDKAIVYNTYQLYRKDMLANLKSDFFAAEREGYFLGAKLVRGAYLEKENERALSLKQESVIFREKQDCDKAYNDALQFCIGQIQQIAFMAATHNEESCLILTELMKKAQLVQDHAHIYFGQLLGMGDNISANLAYAGYNVAKYVPYGPVKTVLPYLFRRAEENKSVLGQASREFALLKKEKLRRGI